MQQAAAPFNPSELLELVLSDVQLVAHLARFTRTHADPADQVPPGARRVLTVLIAGPMTVPRIAQACGTSRQNVQVLVNSLASEGLVELVSNPAHKKSALVRLTDKGQGTAESVVDHGRRRIAEMASSFSAEELAQAREMLRRLADFIRKDAGRVEIRKPLERPESTERASRETAVQTEVEMPISLL